MNNRFSRIRTSGEACNRSFKKGDRVMWKGKDEDGKAELKHGTVTRGGVKVHATMDGGEYEVKGGRSAFQFSDKPMPKDAPSPMDDYAVTGYKSMPEISDETLAFVATITFKGKPVLFAKNGGCGGDTEIRPTGENGYKEAYKEFFDAAKAWAKQFGQTNAFEAYSDWIEWYVNKRPFAVTAKQYNEDMEAEMAKYRKKTA